MFRIDRLVSTGLVWPVMRVLGSSNPRVIPILMYHSVSPELDTKRTPYYRMVTSPQTFAAHLRLLDSEGFDVVTLSTAVEMLRNGREAITSRAPVVITFDDGLADFYTHAFPLLDDRDFRATVFLASGCIDGLFPTGDACLTSTQVRELARRGVEFGSHSVTHVRLVDQTADRLEQELAASKADIERIIGQDVNLFSFPFRFPAENRRFVNYLQERLLANGYRAGVTTILGRATLGQNIMALPRLPINDCDDEILFRAKLRGAYDWVRYAQITYKKGRSLLAKSNDWSE